MNPKVMAYLIASGKLKPRLATSTLLKIKKAKGPKIPQAKIPKAATPKAPTSSAPLPKIPK